MFAAENSTERKLGRILALFYYEATSGPDFNIF